MAGKWKHKTLRNNKALYFCTGDVYSVDGEGCLHPNPSKEDEVILTRSSNWTCISPPASETPAKPKKKAASASKPPAKATAKKPSRGATSKSKKSTSKSSSKKK